MYFELFTNIFVSRIKKKRKTITLTNIAFYVLRYVPR
jgi:hypothetical protein